MKYKALFLDIDGTILKPDHTYTNLTKQAIDQVKAHGIEVFIATGRPLHEIKELGDQLNIQSFIGYNGAYAILKDEVIVNEPIDSKIVEQFLRIASDTNHEMVLYTNNNNYFTNLSKPIVQDFIQAFQLRKNKMLTPEVIDQILGITVMDVTEEQSGYYNLAAKIRLSQVNVEGYRHAYDLIRTDVNKGEAVQKILRRLGIHKQQAIAFGDGLNDKEMLQSVGESFAMENAHPDLFQYAKHHTTSVTD